MSGLSKLKIVALQPRKSVSAEQQRRIKLVEKLTEQLKLVEAALGGEEYQRTRWYWHTDEDGNRKRITRTVKLRQWWVLDGDGKVQFGLRYVFHPGRSHRPSSFCIFHGTFGPEGHSGVRPMLIHLHSQATTTPKVRAEIQASDEPGWVLAERFGTSEQTVWKWRKRDSVHDRSHTAHRLQTTLTPAQEAVAVALRKTLLVSLDDLLAVVRAFLNPNVSRSGLDRCLRRHGVGNLRDLKVKAARPKHSGFKAYEPGYIHIDVKYLPQMADETSRRYLFVAIDRATRWVFIHIYNAKTAANARRFLRDIERACPMRIRTILTDNGKEFTDRLFGLRKRAQSGKHEFDRLCADLDIEHRLTPPRSPQTNGMVERFNGRIEDVLQGHHFRSGEELHATLNRYVWLYNQQLPQSALGSKTPLHAMKDWHKRKPQLFKKKPCYRPGCDS